MLVKELIAKLQELPEHLQNASVLIDTDRKLYDVYDNLEVQKVTAVKGSYIFSNMLYEDIRCSVPSLNTVVLSLS